MTGRKTPDDLAWLILFLASVIVALLALNGLVALAYGR